MLNKLTNPFNLQQCVEGIPCVTASGKQSSFIMMHKPENQYEYPLVMSTGNYKTDGTNGDPSMALSMMESIDFNILSPTAPLPGGVEFLESFEGRDNRQCLNLGFNEFSITAKTKKKK